MNKSILKISAALCLGLLTPWASAKAEMQDLPIVRLQSLNKITARTMIFEMQVGKTVRFGPMLIKAQSCRKSEPIDTPEAAAFLQIWEETPRDGSKWVYSGWLFASSPGLSSVDHPIYDVWVLDCMESTEKDDGEDLDVPQTENAEQNLEQPVQ